jgi:predicted transposase/invertase (TIGR01784 family)
MAHYLDPKNDLTFKYVFGVHKNLCMSLLNNMLPLQKEQQIVNLEYQTNELIPEIPLLRDSIVDVCCTDNSGRQFIVEMQMIWTPSFKHRVLLNASKAYVRQLDAGQDYRLAKPVYALNFVNDNFDPNPLVYYHDYKMVNVENTEKQIEGLELVFIELPKFSPSNRAEKKLYNLWLTYLTGIKKGDEKVPQELMEEDVTREAVQYLEINSYTKAELNTYDKYLDIILTTRTYQADSKAEGLAEGLSKGEEIGIAKGEAIGIAKGEAIGIAKGETIGIAKGEEKKTIEMVINGARLGFSLEQIQLLTNLSKERIKEILNSKIQ